MAWQGVRFAGWMCIKMAKGTLLALLLFAFPMSAKASLRGFWMKKWLLCTHCWSVNQHFIKNHWGYDAKEAEKFIARVITDNSGIAPGSTWKRMQLLSAVGELLVEKSSWSLFQMMWKLYDAAVFIFVGEWALENLVMAACER